MNEQDPWDRIHDCDRDLPNEKGPSAVTLACVIVGMLGTLGFACYGFYRIACWLLNLAP